MQWILVLQLLVNGQTIEVRSAPFDDAGACERSRDDWIERGADKRVKSAECVSASPAPRSSVPTIIAQRLAKTSVFSFDPAELPKK